MKRRSFFKIAGASGLAATGLAVGSGSTTGEPEVTSEVVAPKEGIRGLGTNQDLFFSVHPSDAHDTGDPYWYYFDESGDIDSSGEFPGDGYVNDNRNGCDASDEASYVSELDEIDEFTASGDVVAHVVPATVQSLAYDESAGELWGGGENGRVWRFDAEMAVEQSLAVPGSVVGLAHDGQSLWAGTDERSDILQINPSTGDTVETYEYPVSVTTYDLTYLNDRLWIAGDGRLYETDLSASGTANPTPTPTSTDASTQRIDESAVTSEVIAPKGGIRGLGSAGGWFFSTHPSDTHDTLEPYWYYFDDSGSVDNSGEFPGDGYVNDDRNGCALSAEGRYASNHDEIDYARFSSGDRTTHTAPAEIQSLAYDDSGGALWGGGANGRVWQFDDQITVERTYDFSGSVFGLAHDGQSLWVGDQSGEIKRFDPATGDIDTTFEYPVSVTVYDLTYLNDRLWIAGDGRLYETNLSASTTTATPTQTTTATETPTATRTPTPTATRTPTATDAPPTTDDQQTPDAPPGPGGTPDDNPFEPPDEDGTATASATESPEPTETRSPEPTETVSPTATQTVSPTATQTVSPTATPDQVDEQTDTSDETAEPADSPETTAGSGPGLGIVTGLATLGVGAWRFSESESDSE